MSFANLQIREGFANFFQPYSATILPMSTSIEKKGDALTKAYWICNTDYEIKLSAQRLARDNADVQLGNTEREIMRIVCCYTPNQIIGIEDMFYRGEERIYGVGDNYAKSNWESRIIITVKYHISI